MPNRLTIEREDGTEVKLPWSWSICDDCGGDGTTTRHVECDGGGITGSEMAELCHDDPDLREDYFSGKYDRPCPECRGSGKIKVVDRDRIKDVGLLAEYDANVEADIAYASERWAEQRMRDRGYVY